MALFASAIFLSSFLLFLIQPIFAKLILPWFGGSSSVWIMCLVFFQVALLAGYVYAHFVSSRLGPTGQVRLHIALLVIALAFLPVIPAPSWKPSSGEDPTWRILGLLTAVLGVPYVALSSTSPLLQSWYARRWPESQPYRLFALSNVAALLALCAYPLWIEPRFATRAQDVVWSIGFAAFAVLAALSALKSRDAQQVASNDPGEPGIADRAIWIALAAGGSMLLLSTTNQLTQNVAPVPLLWILPLAIYLLTFILCFESTRWYRRELFLRLLAVALASVGYAIYDIQESTPILIALPVFAVGLFLGCMYCHGELSRLKPHGTQVTQFYLMVALGGALGAVFVGLIAPLVFSAVYELPVALLLVAIVAAYLNWSGGWPQRMLWFAVTVAMALVLISEVRGYRKDTTVMVRNFYGGLRVVQSSSAGSEVRTLYHGTIEHGAEFTDPGRRMAPTSYYGPPSGAGLALRFAVSGSKRVGIIGLGVGTLGAYGQTGDDFEFYEINPQVIEIANSQFFYLRDNKAGVHVTLGDARLSLERQRAQAYDVLVVDAFSGDAIPVHLLTREAFELYFKHLKPMGVLAIHVSNQYLDLAPVVQKLASFFQYPAALVHSNKDDKQLLSAASWMLITRNRDFWAKPEISDAAEPVPSSPALRLWTDDYNNLLQVIRWAGQ